MIGTDDIEALKARVRELDWENATLRDGIKKIFDAWNHRPMEHHVNSMQAWVAEDMMLAIDYLRFCRDSAANLTRAAGIKTEAGE